MADDHGSGVNQFIPFATGVGANVLDIIEYVDDQVTQQGLQTGIVHSPTLNAILRQGTFIASMIAQFTADYTGVESLDDGDLITMEDKFVAALQIALSPLGVYFVVDTGTANAVVGTSSPAPERYTPPCFVIFKKAPYDNTGPMTINLWGIGAVTLRDNTGANFSAASLKANSFYCAAWDGGGFRILGGAATYTNITDLTANSGDGVEVTAGGGIVNRRRSRGTHNPTPAALDKWARGKASDDTDLWLTSTEFLSWLQDNLSFSLTVPPNGFGTAVGQIAATAVLYPTGYRPAHAGLNIGYTCSGSALSTGNLPNTVPGIFLGIQPINSSGGGGDSFGGGGTGLDNSLARVVGSAPLTGTWRLEAYLQTAVSGWPIYTASTLLFKRIA